MWFCLEASLNNLHRLGIPNEAFLAGIVLAIQKTYIQWYRQFQQSSDDTTWYVLQAIDEGSTWWYNRYTRPLQSGKKVSKLIAVQAHIIHMHGEMTDSEFNWLLQTINLYCTHTCSNRLATASSNWEQLLTVKAIFEEFALHSTRCWNNRNIKAERHTQVDSKLDVVFWHSLSVCY